MCRLAWKKKHTKKKKHWKLAQLPAVVLVLGHLWAWPKIFCTLFAHDYFVTPSRANVCIRPCTLLVGLHQVAFACLSQPTCLGEALKAYYNVMYGCMQYIASSLHNEKIFIKFAIVHDQMHERNTEECKDRIRVYPCISLWCGEGDLCSNVVNYKIVAM